MVSNLTQRATTKQTRSVCSEAQHAETGVSSVDGSCANGEKLILLCPVPDLPEKVFSQVQIVKVAKRHRYRTEMGFNKLPVIQITRTERNRIRT